MDHLHLKVTETKIIDFDVKVDIFRVYPPWKITVIHKGKKKNDTHIASIPKIKSIVRKIEAARKDRFIDCTKLESAS